MNKVEEVMAPHKIVKLTMAACALLGGIGLALYRSDIAPAVIGFFAAWPYLYAG